MINFRKSITPGILPVYFYVGRNHQPTYEFYYPSAGSRQLGFGQLPIHPFFPDLVQWRQTITSGIEYDWLKNLAPDTNTISLENWIIASFTTVPCRLWWAEQSKHIFYAPVDTYCHRLDPSSMVPVDEVPHHPLLYLFFFLFSRCIKLVLIISFSRTHPSFSQTSAIPGNELSMLLHLSYLISFVKLHCCRT